MALFPTTKSAVFDLANADTAKRSAALDIVIAAYWRPVYAFIRLKTRATPEHAEDLTQSFFEQALDRDTLRSYVAERARFRTFLRTCLERFLIDEHRASRADIRRANLGACDFASVEAELESANQLDPEAAFEAQWLRHVMNLAVKRLEDKLLAQDRALHLELFHEFHGPDEPPTYAEAAARHNISTSNVTNWLHATRRELKRIALDLLAELTVDEADYAEEARAVFGIDLRETS